MQCCMRVSDYLTVGVYTVQAAITIFILKGWMICVFGSYLANELTGSCIFEVNYLALLL